jgi:hypothetical protein
MSEVLGLEAHEDLQCGITRSENVILHNPPILMIFPEGARGESA